MPISGVLLHCKKDKIHTVEEAIGCRPCSQVRSVQGGMAVVVTDTATLEEDRAEVEALGALPGVLLSNVIFTNLEDVAAKLSQRVVSGKALEEAVT